MSRARKIIEGIDDPESFDVQGHLTSPVARLAKTNGFKRKDRVESEERWVKLLSDGKEAWLRTTAPSDWDRPMDFRDPGRHGGREWEFVIWNPVAKELRQVARANEMVMSYLLGAILQRLATWPAGMPKPGEQNESIDFPDDPNVDDPEAFIKREVERRAVPIKEIQIFGRRWFNRGPGNTYYSAQILINGKLVHRIPFAYGYGDQFLYDSFDWLEKHGYVDKTQNEPPWVTAERMGFNLIYDVSDVKRKRDL